MGFTLPHTRLAFKHLRPLSCQRLGPPATLITWVSTLYVRRIDSLEFQDVILTKLYNESPPQNLRGITSKPWGTTMSSHQKGSWNYVLTMRHRHEISPRDSWNYVLTMRHHHEISPRDSWNYALNHTKIMSHQPNIKLSCILISCQYL